MDESAARNNPKKRAAAVVGLGWTVFFVLWALFILSYNQGGLEIALRSALIATAVSAVGSLAVWKFTGRYPWPKELSARFIALHIVAASVFGLVWTATGPVVAYTVEGMSLSDINWTIAENSWRLLMGVWLYGILAGLSYASRMRGRLKDEELRSSQAEALAAEARIKALRANLQPHFLFNALHSISALIRTDPTRAEDAVERLGGLLRTTVKEHASELIPLAQEWEFVQDYLELQKVRYGERLRIKTEIEEMAMDVQVPIFSLQTLIENAVIHGMEHSGEGVSVLVQAGIAQGEFSLKVTDDGPGPGGSNVDVGSGQGLTMLRERLEALYGTGASLTLRSGTGGIGSCAELRLGEHARP